MLAGLHFSGKKNGPPEGRTEIIFSAFPPLVCSPRFHVSIVFLVLFSLSRVRTAREASQKLASLSASSSPRCGHWLDLHWTAPSLTIIVHIIAIGFTILNEIQHTIFLLHHGSASAAGCHPAYSPDSDYAVSNLVSQSITTVTPLVWFACDVGTD